MTPEFPEEFWPERLQAAFKLPLDDLVERFILQHDHAPGRDAPDFSHFDRPAGQQYLPGGLPVFVPECYEEKYAYPLIVWLHSGENRRSPLDHMPGISTRNYFGLNLAVDEFTNAAGIKPGAQLAADTLDDISDEIYAAVAGLRCGYHIHTERIFLAGLDATAGPALGVMLRRPDWFAGAMTFSSRYTPPQHSMTRYSDLQGKRVLLAAGTRSSKFSLADFLATGRLLHTAGIEVSPQLYDCGDKLPHKLLADINEWVMAGIYESYPV
jgi:predicted esterase